MKHNSAIKEIESSYATIIIDTRQPLGLFYLLDNGIYIGIDNSTGDAWTEEFSNLHQCREWLLNPSLSAPSMEWWEESINAHTPKKGGRGMCIC